jgi:hypothetical protein
MVINLSSDIIVRYFEKHGVMFNVEPRVEAKRELIVDIAEDVTRL